MTDGKLRLMAESAAAKYHNNDGPRFGFYDGFIAGHQATISAQQETINTLVGALEFYAEGRERGKIAGVEYDEETDGDVYIGKLAREALAKVGKHEEGGE